MRSDAGGTRPRVAGACAAIAIVCALAGCASAPEPQSVSSMSSAATLPLSMQSATPRASSSALTDEEQSVSATSRASAVAIASRTVAAFCRPTLTPAAWLSALKPDLTADAASAYATVLPARVPCHRVTGAASPTDGDGFTQTIRVPTDAGACLVLAQRPDGRTQWRVGRIVLPSRDR